MRRRFGWHTDPADTIALGDLVQASFSSVMAFSEPGDAILLQLPSYPPFMRAIEDTGRRLIVNPMRDDGTRWVLDFGAYEMVPDPRLRSIKPSPDKVLSASRTVKRLTPQRWQSSISVGNRSRALNWPHRISPRSSLAS